MIFHSEIPERQDAVGATRAQDVRLNRVPGDAGQADLDQERVKEIFPSLVRQKFRGNLHLTEFL